MKPLSHSERETLTTYAGRPIAEVAGALGVSERTARRRLQAFRGATRAKSKHAPLPATAATDAAAGQPAATTCPTCGRLPEGGALALLHSTLATVSELLTRARDAGRGPEVSQLGRTVAVLASLEHRLTPPVPPDPSDLPDVRAAADEASELLHRALDRAIERRRAAGTP